jgi:hypothetical protein
VAQIAAELAGLVQEFGWWSGCYGQVRTVTPSDTTVHNMVAKLYTSIHGDIVRALAVSILLLYTINTDHSTACEEQDLLCHQHMDDTPDDVLICRDAGVMD